jgi:hypothetical protein
MQSQIAQQISKLIFMNNQAKTGLQKDVSHQILCGQLVQTIRNADRQTHLRHIDCIAHHMRQLLAQQEDLLRLPHRSMASLR